MRRRARAAVVPRSGAGAHDGRRARAGEARVTRCPLGAKIARTSFASDTAPRVSTLNFAGVIQSQNFNDEGEAQNRIDEARSARKPGAEKKTPLFLSPDQKKRRELFLSFVSSFSGGRARERERKRWRCRSLMNDDDDDDDVFGAARAVQAEEESAEGNESPRGRGPRGERRGSASVEMKDAEKDILRERKTAPFALSHSRAAASLC